MTVDILWQFATVIMLPAIGYLFLDNRSLRQKLDDFRVEVAKNYATNSYIQEVEKRLTEFLVRIEQKIEKHGSD